MRNIFTYFFLIISLFGFSQSPSKNYIKNITYRNASTLNTTLDTLVNITYYDGLGRPLQIVNVKAGGNRQDIVTPFIYDEFGRETKKYLPYSNVNQTVSSPNYRDNTNLLIDINTLYLQKFPNDIDTAQKNPYSETFFEKSPLNRILKQAAPGKQWKGNLDDIPDHTVKYSYSLNVAGEVRKFNVNFPTPNNTEITNLTCSGYYGINELYKKIIYDENWTISSGKNGIVEEFTDKEGRILLKRTYDNDKPHDTFYVYDKFSNLTYVIPPLASDVIIKSSFTVNQSKIIYPWTKILVFDPKTIDAFDAETKNYTGQDLLNLDLMDKYGAKGGFSISPDNNNNISLGINITTTVPVPLKTGIIIDLSGNGIYADKELGRIEGSDYQYIFSIKNNMIEVDGFGKLSSVNANMTGDHALEYAKNYPWTKLCDADPTVIESYEKAIENLDNSLILSTYTPNNYGASGGVAISVDEFDTLTFSLNINSDVAMNLLTGNIFPLDISRSIPDRTLGTLSGDGYNYEFSIKNNYLFVEGYGKINTASHFSNQFTRYTYQVEEQVVNGLCYIYHYDKRNRLVEKHIPDNDWTFMVYDQLDRLILTQDAVHRTKNQWLYTKYDRLDRIIMTGLYNNSTKRKDIQNSLDLIADPILHEKRTSAYYSTQNALTLYYTNDQAFPIGGEIYTVQYYDDYIPFGSDNMIPENSNSLGMLIEPKVLSKPTGTKTKILGTQYWETNVTGYDDKDRAVWIVNKNEYLNSEDRIENLLAFTGEVTRSIHKHIKSGNTITTYDTFSYDHRGRLLNNLQAQNPLWGWDLGPESNLITGNKYDELGNLIQKKVGNNTSSPLQVVDYTYNIRGWLKGINNTSSLGNDLFAFSIGYDNLYNGNIYSTKWRTLNDNIIKTYTYEYDNLNRLTFAKYTSSLPLFNYNEGASYDKNGNISGISRNGIMNSGQFGIIDQLSYIYKPYSNQLLKVTDSGDVAGFKDMHIGSDNDYSYDISGNMTVDLNKEIGIISYNHLNLPILIFKDANNKITYIYNALGQKIEKRVITEGNLSVTQYANGFVYKDGGLEYFPHPEGYARYESNGHFKYIYQYKDHLGNVRLSYADNNEDGAVDVNEIIEESNYYPFGLQHKNYFPVTSSNLGQKIKYNGKELQDEMGLNIYDYGARNYDPAIGRWFNIDPLAEKMRRFSPYTYAFDNPVYFIDPDGMQSEDWIKWVNGQKQQVYNPKANGGKGGYTKYASATDKKFGDALRNSGPTGAAQFNKLVTSKTEVTVNFGGNSNSENLGYVLGYTDFDSTDYTENTDKSINLHNADINIYTEGIGEFVNDINSGKVKEGDYEGRQKDDVKTIKENNMSAFDVAVSVFGHEIEHGTDPANVTILANERRGTPIDKRDSELIPRKKGNEILHDLAN